MEMAERMIRLDKYLADMKIGTRSEVKKYIRNGLVKQNGNVVRSPETKISQGDVIAFKDEVVAYEKYVYYMLHKPAGVISATEDRRDRTVLDLFHGVNTKGLFPVGRLDKDTEGLLLVTNDGDLAHRLLAPKRHVDKTYEAVVSGIVTKEDCNQFETGLDIGEKRFTLPAKLKIIEVDQPNATTRVEVTIQEGKFHQIKRMFRVLDKNVIYLKRLTMGRLALDPRLEKGDFRRLTDDEIRELIK